MKKKLPNYPLPIGLFFMLLSTPVFLVLETLGIIKHFANYFSRTGFFGDDAFFYIWIDVIAQIFSEHKKRKLKKQKGDTP